MAPAVDATAEELREYLEAVADDGEVLAGHVAEFFKGVARLSSSAVLAKKAEQGRGDDLRCVL